MMAASLSLVGLDLPRIRLQNARKIKRYIVLPSSYLELENSIFRGAIIGMIRNNIPMAKKYLNCLGDEFKNMFAL